MKKAFYLVVGWQWDGRCVQVTNSNRVRQARTHHKSSAMAKNYDSHDTPGLSPVFPSAHWLPFPRAVKPIGPGRAGGSPASKVSGRHRLQTLTWRAIGGQGGLGPAFSILETPGRHRRSVAPEREARGGRGDCVAQAQCGVSSGSPDSWRR